jgi:GxxExxY protein
VKSVVKKIMDEINQLTYNVIGCAYKVHSALGPGLLESTYEACLAYELIDSGYKVETQKALPVVYNEVKLDAGYRIDILVDDRLIIELKSVEAINDVHIAQILTYLKLSGIKVGLLINFNVKNLKEGIRRFVM